MGKVATLEIENGRAFTPAETAPHTCWAVRACPDRGGKMAEAEVASQGRKRVVQEGQTKTFPK